MKKNHQTTFSFLLFFTAINFYAQQTEVLPNGLTQEEKNILPDYQFTKTLITPHPEFPVRTSAQWEEVEYLLISWEPEFQNIQKQIVQAAVDECKVIIVTQNQNSVQNYLQNAGVSMTNVEFLNAPTNSIWIRDYAANTVYANDVGNRALVDWIYNRPRPQDDVLPSEYADYLNIPLYITNSAPNDLVNTGGNFMSDGLGNAFASKLILDENDPGNPYGVTPKTEPEIDAIFHDYMGINSYRKMTTLPYDMIHHIDMHMKLLDEETLLVSEYPAGVADGPQIEANLNYILTNFQTPFGNEYDVIRIPAPKDKNGQYPNAGGSYCTYTNAVILNKTILVPVYRAEVDEEALNIWRDAMPGYRIVGIDVDNNGEDLISLSGAIHCITHTVGVENPLWIVHEKIRGVSTTTNILVEAQIKHISGVAQAKVFWRKDGETNFHEVTMSPSNGDNWMAELTVPADAEKINYYIWAESVSGKELTRPMVAPEGYWTFSVNSMETEEWAKENIIGPYPNPAKDEIHFKLKDAGSDVKITIQNLLGQQLYEKDINDVNQDISIKLKPAWKGTLLITIEGKFGKVTRKLIKL